MNYDLNTDDNHRTLQSLTVKRDGTALLWDSAARRLVPITRRMAYHYLHGWRWLVKNRPERGYVIDRYPLF